MTWADRKKRTGSMLCYPFEEKRLAKWEPPFIVQPKLDGVRCRAVWLANQYVLLSSTEEIISSVPHINQALLETGLWDELDGELYIHGSSFEQTNSVVSRTVNIHPEFDQVQFHIFDLVDEKKSQLERTNWLTNHLVAEPPLVHVPTFVAIDLDQIMDYYVQFLNKGFEGIIVRHIDAPYIRRRSTWVMKFKPKRDDWYTVVGYKEELDKHGEPKGTLGALVCSGDDGTEFSVGSGLTAEQRTKYWANRERLPGSLCHVQYQHITPGKNVPRFPVFVEVE